ncbi:hypothetical protein MtrunA17_Chr1g0155061 [Medicago truncatula]|uniref:Transmembrane protein n=1 Tax=Medicago truncatula TaxID=3880 RepID=A0A396JGW6_MEDTR|nr:hypothetical protein MtrunA17_Chr1g0155061 [Medicago truncatula]
MSGALAWQIRKSLIKLQLFCFEREERDRFGDSFFLRLSIFSLCCVCVLPLASLFFCSVTFRYSTIMHDAYTTNYKSYN